LKKADIYIPNDDSINIYTLWTDYYSYDALNRLTAMYEQNGGSNPFGQGYVYDRYGNRQINQNSSVTYGGVNNQTSTISTSTNRMTAIAGVTQTLDNAGNMTGDGVNVTRSFDAENRLSSTTVYSATSSYVYDGDGRRVRRTAGSTSVWHIYGFDECQTEVQQLREENRKQKTGDRRINSL
jgi:YD repeat-containing protein